MNQQLELVISKLRMEFEQRSQEYGKSLHANFNLQFDVQDGNIVHGILNGIRFRVPSEKQQIHTLRKNSLPKPLTKVN